MMILSSCSILMLMIVMEYEGDIVKYKERSQSFEADIFPYRRGDSFLERVILGTARKWYLI